MTAKIKISVIIPTFNRSQYICDAIDSVLAQTYPAHEIIIADDGSTDNTAALLKKYGKRIKYLRQKNKGPSAARNLGIKKSTGEFIAFLDSDDLWDKNKLKEQIEFYKRINNFNLGMIDTFTKIIDFKGKTICVLNCTKRGPALEELFYHNVINQTSSVLIKSSVFQEIGLFNENLGGAEDRELWIRIASKFRIYTVEKYLVNQRKHNENISNDYEFMRANTEKLLKIISKRYEDKVKNLNKVIAFNYAYYLPYYFKSLKLREFRKLLYKCISLYPLVLFKNGKYTIYFILSFFNKNVIKLGYKMMRKKI